MNTPTSRRIILDALTAEFPHLRPRRVPGPACRVRVGDALFEFANLQRRSESNNLTAAALGKEACRWVRTSLAAAKGTEDEPVAFAKVSRRLRPQLFPQAKAGNKVLRCGSFAPGVETAVVVDDRRLYRYVSPAAAREWGKSGRELFDAAVANLERIVARETVACARAGVFGRSCVFQMQDGYAAARILLASIRRRIGKALGFPFYFAIPARDLLVCWRPLPTQEDQFAAYDTVLRLYQTVDHPLSPCSFRMQKSLRFSADAIPVLDTPVNTGSKRRASSARLHKPLVQGGASSRRR